MSQRAVELKALTGLRGLLALWVVVLHTALGMEQRGFSIDARIAEPVGNLIFAGVIAVDGFFILSGFILSHVYADRFRFGDWRYAPKFLALRLARIYPVHLTVLLLYVLIVLAGLDWPADHCGNPFNRDPALCNRFGLREFIESALLVNSWGLDPQVGWNLPAWSIASEWFVYLLFPVLVVVAAQFAPRRAAITGLAALTIMIPLLYIYALTFRSLGDDYGLLRVVPEFICGLMLYRVYRAPAFESWPWPSIGLGAAVIAITLIATHIVPIAAVYCLAILVLALASTQTGLLNSALATSPMQFLGRISFSVYMVNLIVLELLSFGEKRLITGNPLKHVWQGWATLALGCLMCVAAGWMMYRVVEQPARSMIKRRLND